MSRIGKLPIAIPKGVEVKVDHQRVTVKGQRGELQRAVHPDLQVTLEDAHLRVARPTDSSTHRALHGLTRTLLANMVQGVSRGYEKQLELVGVGYRASKQGTDLVLAVGYSHPVRLKPPVGITIEVPDATHVQVQGIDKELVGALAAQIRAVREPEPYKGKGIMYRGEKIRRKAGKTGKTTGAAGATGTK
jgi:large subunit ribosomal protein L6